MPQATSSLGIKSIAVSLTQALTLEKKLRETPLFDKNGAFNAGDLRDPIFSFEVSGKGDVPSGIAIGGTVASGNAITGVSGGISIVENLEITEHTDEYNEFKFSGRNWPSAA